MNKKIFFIIAAVLLISAICIIGGNNEAKANDINKKICWGIKRNDNHEQPDLGKENKELIDKYNGMAMGGKNKKYIYFYSNDLQPMFILWIFGDRKSISQKNNSEKSKFRIEEWHIYGFRQRKNA